MKHTTVSRIEQQGEAAVPYPTLPRAMAMPPRHAESYVATSLDGVHLADAEPCSMEQASFISAEGICLRWRLTLAGSEVLQSVGWKAAS